MIEMFIVWALLSARMVAVPPDSVKLTDAPVRVYGDINEKI